MHREIWHAEEDMAMWPRRQRWKWCSHKRRNASSLQELGEEGNGFSPKGPGDDIALLTPWSCPSKTDSGLLNYEKVRFNSFKSLNFWQFVTATIETNTVSKGCLETCTSGSHSWNSPQSWSPHSSPCLRSVLLVSQARNPGIIHNFSLYFIVHIPPTSPACLIFQIYPESPSLSLASWVIISY